MFERLKRVKEEHSEKKQRHTLQPKGGTKDVSSALVTIHCLGFAYFFAKAQVF
jgi:hypothetical protein